MKTENEVETAMDKVDDCGSSKFPAMTYEQGVREALGWILGDIDDEEFEYS